MILKKKNKTGIPKKYFEFPLKHRFTFVPEGWSYFEGYSVQISGKIGTKKHAFFVASEVFLKDHPKCANGSVAVFYGDVESSDCSDKLFGAYNLFNGKKKFLKF